MQLCEICLSSVEPIYLPSLQSGVRTPCQCPRTLQRAWLSIVMGNLCDSGSLYTLEQLLLLEHYYFWCLALIGENNTIPLSLSETVETCREKVVYMEDLGYGYVDNLPWGWADVQTCILSANNQYGGCFFPVQMWSNLPTSHIKFTVG